MSCASVRCDLNISCVEDRCIVYIGIKHAQFVCGEFNHTHTSRYIGVRSGMSRVSVCRDLSTVLA